MTDALRDGAENELVVWAAPADPANARPGGVASADEAKAYDVFRSGEPSGWYPAGIFADVALQLVPAVRVENVFVRPSFREKAVGVALEVANYGRAAATVTVRTEVRSLDGAPTQVHLSDEITTVPAGRRMSVTRRSGFPDAVPWPDGGDGPSLYVVRTSVIVDGRTTDLVTTRFGFREVWNEGTDLVLNGRRLRVAADIVTVISSRQRLVNFFDALRSIGVNAIFLHWNDGTRTFYDVADEAGMIVMPELYCAGPPQLTMPVVAPPGWVDGMAREYEAWVTLRRNHASIALWSPYDIPPATGVQPADLERFDGQVRTADPTRPILGRDVLETPIVNTHQFLTDPRERFRVAVRDAVEPIPHGRQAAARRRGREPRPGHAGRCAGAPRALRTRRHRGMGRAGPGQRIVSPPRPGSGVAEPVGARRATAVSGRGHRRRRELDRSVTTAVHANGLRAHAATTGAEDARDPDGAAAVRALAGAVGRGTRPMRRAGYALAAPMSGAGGIERGTLLDPEGKGWLLLPEPGTYRVRLACDGFVATTVEAKGTRFTGEPGFGNLQEVRLDRAP